MGLARGVGLFSCFLVTVAVACGGDEGLDAGDDGASSSSSSSGGSTSSSGSSGTTADAGPTPCTSDDECEGRCEGGLCAAPTTTDGKRSPSLGETDVDCGGPAAPPCGEGLGCAADTDCTTKTCGASKTCVSAPSCRGTNGPAGIETCGAGEPGTPGAAHESCCKSLPLPTTKTRHLDKYEITAGRVREFVTALAAANGGEPDVRGFAKTFAAANPDSELGKLASDFPGLLDILPDKKSPSAALPIQVHLGAFPLDPMNQLDGCFLGPDAYGHATYWQEPADLKPFGVGYPSNAPDGVRKYPREVLDAKAMNCVMPLFLAAFCAWDGGELARTSDYREVWGRTPAMVTPPGGGAATTVFVPWSTLQPVGKFNWRNGHGAACPVPGWPGCVNPQPYHYQFPTSGSTAADDDSAAIGAPGRFPLDVTKATSNDEGWLDIGGNMMEAAWPNGPVNTGANPVKDVCDVTTTTGGTACARRGRNGIRRYTGNLPHIALVGYSFEGHARRSEAYLASNDGDESRLVPGDLKPVTFQYGKVGGRCARPAPP